MITKEIGASLLKMNTFGIEARAKEIITFDAMTDAPEVARMIADKKHIVIGGGSNLLFLGDYDGIVIRPQNKELEVTSHEASNCTVAVGAGMVWDDFVSWSVEQGLHGAENLSGIPGCVGASPVQNVGAYGAEAKDIISKVEAVEIGTGKSLIFSASDCKFGYRDSIFKHELAGRVIVTRVHFTLQKEAELKLGYGALRETVTSLGEANIATVREAVKRIRDSKLPDPKVLGNAGSFFKNPEVEPEIADRIREMFTEMPSYATANGKVKIPAGWLIEQSGWKGKSLGHAGVHDKQALVIVNRGGASGEEIERIADAVRSDVLAKFGIEISPEVNYIR